MEKVLEYLDSKKIMYTIHNHPAVFTCEEAEKYCGNIPGLSCKNLFLRAKKTGNYF
jgi:Ala-tRNA(Pro) deacylase